jgi:hypothetical protein
VRAEETGLVGELDPAAQRGFLLGCAPLNARPQQPPLPTAGAGAGGAGASADAGARAGLEYGSSGGGGGAKAGRPLSSSKQTVRGASPVGPPQLRAANPSVVQPGELISSLGGAGAPPGTLGKRLDQAMDMNALFVEWKGVSGARHAAQVREHQQQLAELKQRIKVRQGGRPCL